MALCSIAGPAWAEVLCADDLVPQGMAVTATGTAPTCTGACRAREVEPVCGPIIKICAGQPIPRGYQLDSVTTMPACQCLGPEDNAYVLRYVGTKDQSDQYGDSAGDLDALQNQDVISQDQSDVSGSNQAPYGMPPFGNILCMRVPSYGNVPEGLSYPPGSYGGNSFMPSSPNGSYGPSGGMYAPAPVPTPPRWNSQQDEPFRVGQ
jgi:hypothetical protein